MTPADVDARDLVGMRSSAALVMALFFAFAFAVLAFYSRHYVTTAWVQTIGVLAILIAAVILVRYPGDPLPRAASAVVAAAGPTAAVCVFAFLPADPQLPLLTWPIGATAAVGSYLAVRGRLLTAWGSMGATVAVVIWWAVDRGNGWLDGVMRSLPSTTVILTASFFALTLRPAARQTVRLREVTTAEVAARAAAEAVRADRLEYSRLLNRAARPVLELIASGAPLSDQDRIECGLVEAHLRDSLRARRLLSPELELAIAAARRRGVRVNLIDDGELSDAPLGAVRGALMAELAVTEVTSVTARVTPPGRPVAATILATTATTAHRIELDATGSQISAEH